MEELSWYVDDTVMRALRSKPGIGRIDRYGGADREVRITLDPVKLDSYGITASAVNAQLRATNANIGSGRSTSLAMANRPFGRWAMRNRLRDCLT